MKPGQSFWLEGAMPCKAAGILSLFAVLAGASFPPPAQAAAARPGKAAYLRLLTESEYRNSIADIFSPGIEVQGRFEPSRRVGGLLAASSTVLSITPAGFEAFTKLADSVATQVVGPKNRGKLVPCLPKTAAAADDACATKFIGQYGGMLYRRPLSSEEIKTVASIAHASAVSSKDFYVGLRYSLIALLTAPDFLFRTEVAVPQSDTAYTLDAYGRASRLSYLMWDTTPDNELLRAAEAGELDNNAGITKQVDRLMASPRLQAGMRAFFADMLQLDTFSNTTKDTVIYPTFNAQVAASAQEETLRTAIDLSIKQNGDIRDLMTTRKTFINRVLASAYNIPFDFDSEWVSFEFPAGSGRSGLLTQISTLAMFSHPGRSSPTERGVALMDIFLCEPTPLPPANVDFSIVNNTSGPLKTVRERLLAHATTPSCASCHTHSDPIGLSLEQFDSIGGYRTTENGVAIDVSGKLNGKAFEGAQGLGRALHDDSKVTSCLARKLYAYGTGANSEDVTPSSLKPLYKTFGDSGYRLRALLKAIATSPEFFRVPAPIPVSAQTAMNGKN